MPDTAASTNRAGWPRDIATLLAATAIPAVGVGLFFTIYAVPTLALAVGLTAALGCTRLWRAPLVAATAAFAGFPIAARVSMTPWPPGWLWISDALTSGIAAAIVAAVAHLAIEKLPRLKPLFAGVVIATLLATMWMAGLNAAAAPRPDGSITQKLDTTPQLTAKSYDEEIYRAYVFRLRAGEHYYPIAASTMTLLNQAGRPPIASRNVLSYRLPTLYWFLASLPPTGASLINAMLALCSLGVIAGYVLARQFVNRPLALLTATLLAATFGGYAGQLVLDTEPWAGVLGLIAVALVVAAYRTKRHTLALHTAAALVAFSAASVRELAVAFLVVGLAAALADRSGPLRRAWTPWALAWVATIAVYAAHWTAARTAFATISEPINLARGFAWFHPDASGLIAGVALFGRLEWLAVWMAWAIVLLGIAGALIAPRDWPTRVMLAGVAALGPATLLVLRPAGVAVHGAPSYWAYVVLPTTVACAPLVFARLASARRESI